MGSHIDLYRCIQSRVYSQFHGLYPLSSVDYLCLVKVATLMDRLNAWKLLTTLQSAYRANHSTETAVFRMVLDMHSTEVILLL